MWKKCLILLYTIISFYLFSDNIPKIFFGTYLPENYTNNLKKNKTHIKSLLENKNQYYDVICITIYQNKEIIFSNLGFHDQFSIDISEFKHNWKNSASKVITDSKNNRYIKISDKTNYYDEIAKYYSNIVFNKRNYKKDGNELVVLENGNILLNKKEYNLNLDYFSRSKQYDEYYFKKEKQVNYILIELSNEKILITELEKKFSRPEKVIKVYELE